MGISFLLILYLSIVANKRDGDLVQSPGFKHNLMPQNLSQIGVRGRRNGLDDPPTRRVLNLLPP